MSNYKILPRIRELREETGLTQAQMAELLSCSQQAYREYELNHREIPIDALFRFAEFHCVSVDYLLGRTNKRELLSQTKLIPGGVEQPDMR